MPSLMPGTPGTKEAYGLSLVGQDGAVRIPPKAFARYEWKAGDFAIAVTTHRGEAGFALLNKSKAETTVFRKYIDQIREPNVAHWFQGKAYALILIGRERIRLAPALLDAFHLKPGDCLMSVKSTTVALSFTPANLWKAKFLRRGLTEAAANIDKLEVFADSERDDSPQGNGG